MPPANSLEGRGKFGEITVEIQLLLLEMPESYYACARVNQRKPFSSRRVPLEETKMAQPPQHRNEGPHPGDKGLPPSGHQASVNFTGYTCHLLSQACLFPLVCTLQGSGGPCPPAWPLGNRCLPFLRLSHLRCGV